MVKTHLGIRCGAHVFRRMRRIGFTFCAEEAAAQDREPTPRCAIRRWAPINRSPFIIQTRETRIAYRDPWDSRKRHPFLRPDWPGQWLSYSTFFGSPMASARRVVSWFPTWSASRWKSTRPNQAYVASASPRTETRVCHYIRCHCERAFREARLAVSSQDSNRPSRLHVNRRGLFEFSALSKCAAEITNASARCQSMPIASSQTDRAPYPTRRKFAQFQTTTQCSHAGVQAILPHPTRLRPLIVYRGSIVCGNRRVWQRHWLLR